MAFFEAFAVLHAKYAGTARTMLCDERLRKFIAAACGFAVDWVENAAVAFGFEDFVRPSCFEDELQFDALRAAFHRWRTRSEKIDR